MWYIYCGTAKPTFCRLNIFMYIFIYIYKIIKINFLKNFIQRFGKAPLSRIHFTSDASPVFIHKNTIQNSNILQKISNVQTIWDKRVQFVCPKSLSNLWFINIRFINYLYSHMFNTFMPLFIKMCIEMLT